MRQLIVQEWISLDGFATDKNGKLDFFTPTVRDIYMDEYYAECLNNIDCILFGKNTYKQFSAVWPERNGDMISEKINSSEKLVFSKSLTNAPWGKWGFATVVSTDLQSKIKELKSVPGKNIIIWGSLSLAQQAMKPPWVRLAGVAGVLDGVHRVEVAREADSAQHFLDVMARRVGENQARAAEALERVPHRVLVHHHVGELGKRVRLGEEMPRVGAVVTHQAAQRGAVVAVIALLDAARLLLVDVEELLHIGADAGVDLLEQVGVARIERVVEVEDPGVDPGEGGELPRRVRAEGFNGELVHWMGEYRRGKLRLHPSRRKVAAIGRAASPGLLHREGERERGPLLGPADLEAPAELADQAGVDLAAAAERYAAGCPRCGATPCACERR
jgi:dihydrofolate reductase